MVMPARWAANTFCLTPPIGRTLPPSATSPVIATSERTLRPVSRLTRAVVIVTPAEGPSLGMAPAGKWTCSRLPVGKATPSRSACEDTSERTIVADSFITSPSWPVRTASPSPSMRAVSTNNTSPPAPVTASPVAMPGRSIRSRVSSRGIGLPSTSSRSSTSIVTRAATVSSLWWAGSLSLAEELSEACSTGFSSAVAMSFAARLNALSRRRSSRRTPASRV